TSRQSSRRRRSTGSTRSIRIRTADRYCLRSLLAGTARTIASTPLCVLVGLTNLRWADTVRADRVRAHLHDAASARSLGRQPGDGELERRPIATPLAPARLAITSQAMRSGGLVFTAGVMPLDAESNALPPGGIGPQTHQAMRNLRALLAAAGSSLDHLVQ